MRPEKMIEETHKWFKTGLGCIAGKREFAKKRYMFQVVSNSLEIQNAFVNFIEQLQQQKVTACLFICDVPKAISQESVESVVRYLSELFAPLNNSNSEEILNGGAFNFHIKLCCPVCNVEVVYGDFDGVAFCPQSNNINDILYDPLMFAPYPCVNLTSDIYAFSLFTSEVSIKDFKKPVYELSYTDRKRLYNSVKSLWQKMAEITISNYINITDTSKCPVHFSEEKSYWYANHQDPAFAELKKELYKHEMPKIYTDRIFEEWEKYFTDGIVPDFSNTAMAGVK